MTDHPYNVIGSIVGLGFSAFVASRIWRGLRDGRIAYWQALGKLSYAERLTDPGLYWLSIGFHTICIAFALWWFCISPWMHT